jgi:hypothetical protein
MSSISNNLIPSKKDHIFISLVFIVLIYVMIYYKSFRASIMNAFLGRAIMLICIIYLTYYNVAHGLTAIIILIGLHVDSDLEGFEQPVGMSEKAVIPTPVPSLVSSSSSAPSPVSSPNDVTTNKDKTKPIAAPTTTATATATTTKIEAFSHHKKLRIEEGMRPKSSKSLNTPFFGTSQNEPSPNWPDNAVFTTAYAPV